MITLKRDSHESAIANPTEDFRSLRNFSLVIPEAKLRASTPISFITRTLDSLGSGPYAIIANFPTFQIGLSLQLKFSDFSAQIDFISI